jgi:hypothetical protein
MQYLPTIPYPDSEKPKLALLEKLFSEWRQHFASAGTDLAKQAEEMVFDGFFPYYFSQRKRILLKRILFIGREARRIAGGNCIDELYDAYRESKCIGDKHLNQSKFHSRMLYIAYAILNGMPEWKDIPYADKIGDTFGDPDGLSFAFMEISKLSNEGEGSSADWPVIDAAFALSTQPRNFIQEEIAILEPHIVITMTKKIGGDKIASLGQLTPIHASESANSYWLDIAGHRSLLIDTSHFSAWGKTDIEDYYVPICDAIRRSEAAAIVKQAPA